MVKLFTVQSWLSKSQHQPKPLSLFVSHAHRSQAYAGVIKRQILTAFDHKLDVFVSSDTDSISAGEHWKTKIKSELSRADLILVVVDIDLASRPWLFFEVGGAWILDKPVIPICHAGMRPKDLPSQLKDYQSVDTSKNDAATRLLKSISKHFELSPRENFDLNEFQKELQDKAGIRKFDLFLSTPMSSIRDNLYEDHRNGIIKIIERLQKNRSSLKIYCSALDKEKNFCI